MLEKEIFLNYELKGWEFTPRIYKILGVSVAFNLLLFFGLTQANILTAKSCATPFVSGVCSVLDTLYVGSSILDADTGFVNKDYVKTELEDAEITFVDLSNETPPFVYPEGYFAKPEDETEIVSVNDPTSSATLIPDIAKTPNPTLGNTMPDLTITPQVTPKPNKNPVIGNLPSGVTDNNPTTFGRNRNRNKPSPSTNNPMNNQSPTSLDNSSAQNNQNQNSNQSQNNIQSNSVSEAGEINRKPFEDLADSLNEKIANNQLDLNQNFIVVMTGEITKEGKLDKKKSRFTRSEGNEQMVIAAKESIEAVGDSGFLQYLKTQGIDRAELTLAQNDEQIYIQLISDLKDPNKANTTASGLNTMVSGLILADKNGIKKLDENTKLLVNNAKVSSNGKNVVVTVLLPKTEAQAMIRKSLNERAEKKNKNQPSGNNETNNQAFNETARN